MREERGEGREDREKEGNGGRVRRRRGKTRGRRVGRKIMREEEFWERERGE